jgi:hypothetical protein
MAEATLEHWAGPGHPGEQPDDERRPPASIEAEQALLGCLLNDPTRWPLVSDLVAAASFYQHEHRSIFAAIDRLTQQQQPVDMITVHDELQRVDRAEDVGGLPYLNTLAGSTAGGFNARRYAEIVARLAAERALIAAVDAAVRTSWNSALPLAERLGQIGSELKRVEALAESGGGGGRVPVLGMADLKRSSEGVRWVVKHVIPAASIGMLFGGSGTFKSFVALDFALHVCHGLPFMGRLTQQGPVVYIAAEGGSGLWGRIAAWHKARGLAVPDDLPLRVVPLAIDLTQDAWRVVDAVQAQGVTPKAVVVDTVSQTYSGEENSANEMAAYLRELGLRFREVWSAAVLLVHHTGHAATERPRGSSAIRANLDFLLSVFRDEKEMLATLGCVKQKDGELFPDATFGLNVVELGLDEDGDKLTSLVASHLSTADEVEQARMYEQAQGRGGRDFALLNLVQSGMSMNDLRRAFYELLEGLDAEAKKKAFFRARKRAMDAGYIDVAEGIVIDRRKGA